jgi:hypothetical protein
MIEATCRAVPAKIGNIDLIAETRSVEQRPQLRLVLI